MRHYLLTRSAYGPDVPLDVNRRRLDLLRGITVRSLAVQTERNLEWLVLIDPRDPLLAERLDVLRAAGYPLITGSAEKMERVHHFDKPWGPWAKYIDWSEAVLTSRIDDDDAYAPFALATFRGRADRWGNARRARRRTWCMETGWRLWHGLANQRTDRLSQFLATWAPRGDHTTVMDMNHTGIRTLGTVNHIAGPPAWLWLRHDLARSVNSAASHRDREAMRPITRVLRDSFDIDWSLVT